MARTLLTRTHKRLAVESDESSCIFEAIVLASAYCIVSKSTLSVCSPFVSTSNMTSQLSLTHPFP